MELLKVSAGSSPKGVAGAIANVARRGENMEISAIGASAVNQAVKSICIARSFLSEDRIDLTAAPYFKEVELDGAEKTSIRFLVECRSLPDGE